MAISIDLTQRGFLLLRVLALLMGQHVSLCLSGVELADTEGASKQRTKDDTALLESKWAQFLNPIWKLFVKASLSFPTTYPQFHAEFKRSAARHRAWLDIRAQASTERPKYEASWKCSDEEIGRSTALLPGTRKQEDWGAECGTIAQLLTDSGVSVA